jgi:hypothetical protein
MDEKPIDLIGWILIGLLFFFLSIAGYISYKSIDFQVLKKLESTPLILPTPILTPAVEASPSATVKP